MRLDEIVLLAPMANSIPRLRSIRELASPGAFAFDAGELALGVSVVLPDSLAAMRLWRSSAWNCPAV